MQILSRAAAGFCGSTMPVAQAMVLDTVTDAKERPKYIGICSSMLGLAFTVGPGISAGITAVTSFRTTFFIAAGIAAVVTVWAALNVKETKKDIGIIEKKIVETKIADDPSDDEPWGVLIYGPAFSFFLVFLRALLHPHWITVNPFLHHPSSTHPSI